MLLTLTGGAGAGKTTLAAALVAAGTRGPARVLHGDDYYHRAPDHGIWTHDEAGIPRLDVGAPQSIDLARLNADTDAALPGAAVVIVEGLFARHVRPHLSCARFDVFVDLPADLRLARKIQRKCVGEGFPVDVLLHNYLTHRRDAHEHHTEPLRHQCDLVVDGALGEDVLARQVWSAVASFRSRRN